MVMAEYNCLSTSPATFVYIFLSFKVWLPSKFMCYVYLYSLDIIIQFQMFFLFTGSVLDCVINVFSVTCKQFYSYFTVIETTLSCAV